MVTDKMSWEEFTTPNFNVQYSLRKRFDKQNKYMYEKGIMHPLNGDMILPEELSYEDELYMTTEDMFDITNDIEDEMFRKRLEKSTENMDISIYKWG